MLFGLELICSSEHRKDAPLYLNGGIIISYFREIVW